MRAAFLVAILVRVLIAPVFYHPDIKSQHFHFQFLGQGVFNIYQYIENNRYHLPYTDTFNYLPFTYITFGLFQKVVSPILGTGFFNWLSDWGVSQHQHPDIMFYLLILKLPYIVADLLIGLILLKFVKDKKILFFWLFNPFSIYLIYVLGNFDVIPVLATLVSYWLIKSEKPIPGYLVLGCAIALKMYPLLFLPFLLLLKPINLKSYLKYVLLTFAPVLITAIPFVIDNSFSQAFFGSGLTQKIIENKIFGIPVFPILYAATLLAFVKSKSPHTFPYAIFILLLSFLASVKFHPQWVLWFFPFVVIYFYQARQIQKTTILISLGLALFYGFITNDHFLFWGHLTLVNNSFAVIPSPYDILTQKIHLNPLHLQQTIQLLLLLIFLKNLIFYENKK